MWNEIGEEQEHPKNIEANGYEWENYFKNLYKKISDPNTECTSIETNEINRELNLPFSMEELTDTIKNLKNKKSPGYDCICSEFLKLSNDRILKILLKFLNLTFQKFLSSFNFCQMVFRRNLSNS